MSGHRHFPIGAELLGDGGNFRVWAPSRKTVHVVIDGTAHTLQNEANGYFSGTVGHAAEGTRYSLRVDGAPSLYPDPASRFQPGGPHGPSQIISPDHFAWSDSGWRGITPRGQVLYELHVGTFTSEGTWAAAIAHLRHLKDLGITCIEMMPVADFVGLRGWGYDGVNLFAPTRLYGQPDDLRQFVDAAHAAGIGVILDIVYNHFGPEGNHLMQFGPYLSDKHHNDWGQCVNYDAPDCRGVRDYFLTNARYWIEEYHFDGYRFDATQAIKDDSAQHILVEISCAAREAAGGRSVYLVCENEPQDRRIVQPIDQGGHGADAVWSDDFHHSAMVLLSGRNEAYFVDYLGSAQEFVSAAKWGFLFQGQFNKWQQKRRGTLAFDLSPDVFIHFIQNHDQIANYGMGHRAHQLSGMALYRAMSALMLLMPQTPLLFQGQEYAADNPFNYFADYGLDLAESIRAGRVKGLSQFASVAQPEMVAALPDPTTQDTFDRCKLNLADRELPGHREILKLYRDLLRIRREDPVFASGQARLDGAVLGPRAFVLRYITPDSDDRLILANFDCDLHLYVVPEPLLAPPEDNDWHVMWSSEHPDYGGGGQAPVEPWRENSRPSGESWALLGRCVVLLRPAPINPGPTTVAEPK